MSNLPARIMTEVDRDRLLALLRAEVAVYVEDNQLARAVFLVPQSLVNEWGDEFLALLRIELDPLAEVRISPFCPDTHAFCLPPALDRLHEPGTILRIREKMLRRA